MEIKVLCKINKFRYGYRTIHGLLNQAGRKVNRKTVQRIMQKIRMELSGESKEAQADRTVPLCRFQPLESWLHDGSSFAEVGY